jgi:hypothetical protein
MPLFRAPGFTVDQANSPGKDFILTEPDGRAMWPVFKTMLDKVEALVPNIDKGHCVVGGFSNGAHAIAALIDGSDGEICKLFSAFLIVEDVGKHDFPVSAYPAVREWLRGPALEVTR